MHITASEKKKSEIPSRDMQARADNRNTEGVAGQIRHLGRVASVDVACTRVRRLRTKGAIVLLVIHARLCHPHRPSR